MKGTVCGSPQVCLDDIRAIANRLLESRQRVLWKLNTIAPMSHDVGPLAI
jgi:hypothetical protein